ncbi:MAG: NAD+ synthase [Candidatus Bipolaricaulaceae bacterium]
MKIAVGQVNVTVGDLPGNLAKLTAAVDEARRGGAELVVFPEHALLGYPPRDLLHRAGFLDHAQQALAELTAASRGIGVVLGHVLPSGQQRANRADPSATAFAGGEALHNVACLLADGELAGVQAKHRLPTFDVFEETRYFTPGSDVTVVQWAGLRLGLSVCEDLWYEGGVLEAQAQAGVDLLVNVSASPYFRGKPPLRHRLARQWAQLAGVPLVYTNLVGGEDELVFDGGSFAVRPDGGYLLAAPPFSEGVYWLDTGAAEVPAPAADGIGEVVQAIVVGICDYVGKNGLPGAAVGISGGVDSAVTAALATQALGPDRVVGAFLPGPYTAPESAQQARALAHALGIRWLEIPIEPAYQALRAALGPHVELAGVVEENLQARLRGLMMMAVSNATGHVVLCPGNKSEVAMGYNTLYGDTVGALAPIGDLLKGEVYEVARYLNDQAGRPLIPAETIARPPSAELRPDQEDAQDLPPYPQLDPVVAALVVDNRPWQELADRFGNQLAGEVVRRLTRSEYKRRQLPLVIKVSPKAFGLGRRWPVTSRFSG